MFVHNKYRLIAPSVPPCCSVAPVSRIRSSSPIDGTGRHQRDPGHRHGHGGGVIGKEPGDRRHPSLFRTETRPRWIVCIDRHHPRHTQRWVTHQRHRNPRREPIRGQPLSVVVRRRALAVTALAETRKTLSGTLAVFTRTSSNKVEASMGSPFATRRTNRPVECRGDSRCARDRHVDQCRRQGCRRRSLPGCHHHYHPRTTASKGRRRRRRTDHEQRPGVAD